MDGVPQISENGFTELEVMRTFMREVDVVSSVRKLDSIKDYLEMLDLYYTDGERKEELLPQLLGQQDLERYTIEVHGLKSASANIGADRLSSMAKDHEFAGKEGRTSWIDENFSGLMSEYRALLGEIRRVLEGWQYGRFAAADLSALPGLDPGEMNARLERVLGFLEDFESKEAAREVEELLGFALPDEVRSTLEKVRSLLKVYEDDQAEETLRGLLG